MMLNLKKRKTVLTVNKFALILKSAFGEKICNAKYKLHDYMHNIQLISNKRKSEVIE